MSTPEDKTQPDIYPEEKRLSHRFVIPGATVSYRKERWLGQKKDFDEEFCPLQNISRGGLSFLCRQNLRPGTELSLQLSIPGERVPLNQLGQVRWSTAADNKNFPYRVGVQFNAYGNKKGQNYPGNLVKIISLEHKFAEQKQAEKLEDTEGDEYKVESS
ncbi:MAG: PilZ domain-containing protein [Candidatus Saccharicenans sp.]|jgi:Tfp pilus assembly protein PilZ|nr:PilZ domain-containing protein [Candidatus Saccharicenans sp.]MDH7492838.1 PilZ domain-containing protein [Candidatus Saccharicenans sp.]